MVPMLALKFRILRLIRAVVRISSLLPHTQLVSSSGFPGNPTSNQPVAIGCLPQQKDKFRVEDSLLCRRLLEKALAAIRQSLHVANSASRTCPHAAAPSPIQSEDETIGLTWLRAM